MALTALSRWLFLFFACSLSLFTHAQEAFIANLASKSLLLDVTADQRLVAVGERGHILISDDGATFTQKAVPTQATLTAVFKRGNRIWAAGHDTTIVYSDDNGETWTIQLSNPDLERPFLDIMFWDDVTGLAVGAYGLFYRTTDGGENWVREVHTELLDPMDEEYLLDLKEEDEQYYLQELNSILPHVNRLSVIGTTTYLAGESGLIASSADRGVSWQRQTTNYTGSFLDIKLIAPDTLIAVGLRGSIFIQTSATADGASDDISWESIENCNTATLNSILPIAKSRNYVLGNNGSIVKLAPPFTSHPYDPFANHDDCKPNTTIKQFKLDSKAAILNAVLFKGKAIAVTTLGIATLNLE